MLFGCCCGRPCCSLFGVEGLVWDISLACWCSVGSVVVPSRLLLLGCGAPGMSLVFFCSIFFFGVWSILFIELLMFAMFTVIVVKLLV